MRKILVGAFVSAAILFAFQSLSWNLSPLHEFAVKYPKDPDTLLHFLSSQLQQSGVYLVTDVYSKKNPADTIPAGTYGWALLHYHKKITNIPEAQQFFAWFLYLLGSLLLCTFLHHFTPRLPRYSDRLLSVIGFALFAILQQNLMDRNWWGTPSHFMTSQIADLMLGWGISGLFLAWWFSPDVWPAKHSPSKSNH